MFHSTRIDPIALTVSSTRKVLEFHGNAWKLPQSQGKVKVGEGKLLFGNSAQLSLRVSSSRNSRGSIDQSLRRKSGLRLELDLDLALGWEKKANNL